MMRKALHEIAETLDGVRLRVLTHLKHDAGQLDDDEIKALAALAKCLEPLIAGVRCLNGQRVLKGRP